MMGFLTDKKILMTGLISERSIAYGIAKAAKREGATLAFTYVNDKLKPRVAELATHFDSDLIFPCDVAHDEEIEQLFISLKQQWDTLDGLVHSIGFAPREALNGDFLESISREAFHISHDISAYSFPALAKAARPMLNSNASLVTLSYLGSERAIPNYNVMGLAKASLEASVRYMATCMGPQGIRVNGISAGPIKTLAAAGIGSFHKIFNFMAENAPLRRNITIEEVGNIAAFLLSELSNGMTGEILHVDGGYNIGSGGLESLA
jgi:enoyl-[acyl-carrier protein] reductase I